jgi:hypothetical protein
MFVTVLAALLQAQAASPQPLLIVLGPQPGPWMEQAASRGWTAAVPPASIFQNDFVRGVEAEVARHDGVDSSRIYLIADGGNAGSAIFIASRIPHLFAAVAAVGGSARPWVETNRLYAANLSQVPILWVNAEDDPARQRLSSARIRFAATATPAEVIEFLATHNRAEPPSKVDCETGSPQFARCFWIEMTKFDPSRRNDVLPPTRVIPGAGAYLDLGRFSYNPAAHGPGIEVVGLPEGNRSPLSYGDRIVAIGGVPIEDARAYIRFMDQVREETSACGWKLVLCCHGVKRTSRCACRRSISPNQPNCRSSAGV